MSTPEDHYTSTGIKGWIVVTGSSVRRHAALRFHWAELGLGHVPDAVLLFANCAADSSPWATLHGKIACHECGRESAFEILIAGRGDSGNGIFCSNPGCGNQIGLRASSTAQPPEGCPTPSGNYQAWWITATPDSYTRAARLFPMKIEIKDILMN